MDPFNPKKDELEKDITYLICPDEKCNLFDSDGYLVPNCEISCPKKNDLVKLVLCVFCGEILELPGDYSLLCRVSHRHGDDNSSFFRYGRFVRLFNHPE